MDGARERERRTTGLSARTAFVLGALCALASLGWAPEGRDLRWAIATDHPDASRLGADVLARGGTAADAAVTAALALGVASPASSGLGGGGFALYYRASDRSLTFLDFRESAPAAATSEMFRGASMVDGLGARASASQVGGLAVAVPGEAAGLLELHARFGRLPLRSLTEPAARLAQRGVEPSAYLARMLGMIVGPADPLPADRVLARWVAASRHTTPSRVRNAALAATIRRLGALGRRGFYEGPTARAIVDAARTRGGLLTLEDLRGYRVLERAPLEQTFGELRWVTAPPPSAGGYTMLASLSQLERTIGPARVLVPDARREHHLIEAWKGAFLDRASYFGDPDHTALPLDALRAPERVAARAALVSSRARPAAEYALPLAPESSRVTVPAGGGTSHFCIVDGEGNVASLTTTINLIFGARISAGGVVLNDEMDDFASAVGAENAFGLPGGAANLPGPNKRPVSTMSPTIVFRGGSPALCIGAAGGSRIVTATQQVALGVLHDGLTLDQALARPRIHAQSDTVEHERELPAALRVALEGRGHGLREAASLGVVQAVTIGADGSLIAGADPRKGGLGLWSPRHVAGPR